MSFQDMTLTCSDCRDSFVFTAGEQEFHASKGFANRPGRCPGCRAARKSQNGGSSSGGGFRSQGGGAGYSAGGRREMHDAVCAECGNNTQVPFAPSGSRPVYCRDCFSKQGSSRGPARSGGGGGGSRFGRY